MAARCADADLQQLPAYKLAKLGTICMPALRSAGAWLLPIAGLLQCRVRGMRSGNVVRLSRLYLQSCETLYAQQLWLALGSLASSIRRSAYPADAQSQAMFTA